MENSTFVYLVIATFVLSYIWRVNAKKRIVFPPGPPADPFIGHARCLPLEYPWKTFAEWNKKWGAIIYIHVLGNPMIIINDLRVARELLDKRGAIYSDRPRCMMHRELMGWGDTLVFLPYGDKFRKQRRMIQQHFNAQATTSFHAVQLRELNTLLNNLLDSPNNFSWHILRATAATVTMATYGRQVVSDNDAYVSLIEKVNAVTIEPGAPGNTMIDLIPALQHVPIWFPGAYFKRFAARAKILIQEALNMPFDFTKSSRASGTAVPSFVSSLLDEYEQAGRINAEDEENIKNLSGGVYSAGVETTESTLLTFLLAMVCYPDVAKRAQEEIDLVIGQDRLPTLEDRNMLPFIDCILKEALRWNPPVSLGISHRAMESDVYAGMSIPRGATIVPNIWQFMQDERYYPQPSHFNPSRFMHETHGDLSSEDYNPLHTVFGFGRRICPGRFFAESEMWMTMANLLAAFDFKRPLDDAGREYVPEVAFTTGMTSRPKDFRCRIVPRNEKYIQLIRQKLPE